MPAKTADESNTDRYKMTDQLKSAMVLITAALLIQACGMFKDKPVF